MKLIAAVLAAFAVTAPALAQETGSARVVPLQVTGDAAARFALVILSDGYTATDMSKFRQHVDRHLNVLWSLEPFRSYRNYVNVYAVEIVSSESGITCDPAHRQPRNTPLEMAFGGGCENPNARGITGDVEASRRYARMATEHFDQILTITNTDTYGGIGGSIATTSGGNALGPYITPHELGHSLGRLTDEYTYSARGVKGPRDTATAEPRPIHLTRLTEAQMKEQQKKWYRWLGEPSESGGSIGRYEGGNSRVSGIWRPSRHSMMISLGYYFDQVSLEEMVQRIARQVDLIAASTPTTAPVAPTSVISIEPAHPVFHELNITWEVDGNDIAASRNVPWLDLKTVDVREGKHTVRVRVVDPTPFVRDPLIRDTSLTATRSWTVDPSAAPPAASAPVAFTGSTQTARAVAGTEVIYVTTSLPADRVPNVTWTINGRPVNAPNSRALALARQQLPVGTHRVTATVSDASVQGQQALEWTVDNTKPTVKYTLSQPTRATTDPDGTPHYHFTEQFTMKLEPTDDQPGYVVSEFRVNGDGWHHYYGWPDAPEGTPFLFTPRGTTIKELVYGSLSSEGLSPQPWEPREPGYGTHTIEYRARDAAGNIGDALKFRVTVMQAK